MTYMVYMSINKKQKVQHDLYGMYMLINKRYKNKKQKVQHDLYGMHVNKQKVQHELYGMHVNK